MRDLTELTVEDFGARVGDAFTTPDGRTLHLVVVERLGEAAGGRRAPFRLAFTEAGDAIHPQGVVRLVGGGLGALDLFVVPIGREGADTHYEAIVT